MTRAICAAIALTLLTSLSSLAEEPHQNSPNPAKKVTATQYPQIVLYSVAWCPHCREANDFLIKNNIPFIKRDVEKDAMALQDLTIKYHSTGVPVIVFGKDNNEIVMKGFTTKLFQEMLLKARSM